MRENVEEMVAIIADAIQFEHAGREFFLRAAKLATGQRAEAMLLSLAEDEVRHAQRLEAEHGALLQTGEWSGVQNSAPRKAAPFETIFPRDMVRARRMIEPSADELEILRLGIAQEDKSSTMYAQAAEKAQTVQGKALFAWLAGEELSHLELLRNTLAFLENPAEFFLLEEGPIFEG